LIAQKAYQGDPPTLRELIKRFCDLGCVERYLSGEMVTEDGVFRVRYLLNPQTGGFIVISDLEDDEIVMPSVVGGMERRLGIRSGYPSIEPPDYMN
jgi:hypothetical protein